MGRVCAIKSYPSGRIVKNKTMNTSHSLSFFLIKVLIFFLVLICTATLEIVKSFSTFDYDLK